MSKIKGIYSKISKKVQSVMVNDEPDDPILKDAPAVRLNPDEVSMTSTIIDTMNIDTEIEADPAQVRKIFNTVVEVFNKSLPDFLAGAVNAEKQKQYLYDSLDASVKEYLSSLDEQAQARALAQWKHEREAQKQELERLRERTREFESKKSEYTEQRLSADRQKRALNEKVRDLEQALQDAETRKEQLEVENRSLANKIKMSGVYETDMEAMRKELSELRSNPIPAETLEEIASLNKKIEELEYENGKLSEANEAAKVKDEMGGAMFKDMQKQASEAKKNFKEAESTIEELTQEIRNRDARITDLQHKIEEMELQLDDDRNSVESIKEIAAQIDKFEIVKANLNEKIRTQSARIAELEEKNKELNETIQSNLYSHAMQQQKMREEIDQIKSDSKDSSDDEFILDLTNE